MRIRITIAAVTAALAVTLVGCTGEDSSSDKAAPTKGGTPTASKSVDHSGAEKAAGVPAKPDAAKRAELIRALGAIDPALVADEDKAVVNARNQCSTINGGGKADMTARARFSTGDHRVTDKEARQINVAVLSVLCPH
ncbi:hypothetical protein [Streptomyces sp. NPDC058964]|uniref:hypothetical protein n=1 Tax=Streptomyces sp. NPDC058964 TaxID=3346681 RepID=UPI0036753C4B